MVAGDGTFTTGAGPGRPTDGASGRRLVVAPTETRRRPEDGAEQSHAGDMGAGSRRQSDGDRGGYAGIRDRFLD